MKLNFSKVASALLAIIILLAGISIPAVPVFSQVSLPAAVEVADEFQGSVPVPGTEYAGGTDERRCWITGVADESPAAGWGFSLSEGTDSPTGSKYYANPGKAGSGVDPHLGQLDVTETWHPGPEWVSQDSQVEFYLRGVGGARLLRVQVVNPLKTWGEGSTSPSWRFLFQEAGNPPHPATIRFLAQGGAGEVQLDGVRIKRCFAKAEQPEPTPAPTATPTPTPTPTAIPAPLVDEFSTSACTAWVGESFDLTWTVRNAHTVQVLKDGQTISVLSSGRVELHPDSEGVQHFELVASSPGGEERRELSVRVARISSPVPTPAPSRFGRLQRGESLACKRESWLPSALRPAQRQTSCPAVSAAATQADAQISAILTELPRCDVFAENLRAQIAGVCRDATLKWAVDDGRDVVKAAYACGGARNAATDQTGVLVQEFQNVPWNEVGRVVAGALAAAGVTISSPVLIGAAAVVGGGLVIWVVIDYATVRNPDAWKITTLAAVEDQIQLMGTVPTSWMQLVDAQSEPENGWHLGWYQLPWAAPDELFIVYPRGAQGGDEVAVLTVDQGERGERLDSWYIVAELHPGDTQLIPDTGTAEYLVSETIYMSRHNKDYEDPPFPDGGAVGAPQSIPAKMPLYPRHIQTGQHLRGADAEQWKQTAWREYVNADFSKGCGQGGPCCQDVTVGKKLYRLITLAVTRTSQEGEVLYRSIQIAAYMGGVGYKWPNGPHTLVHPSQDELRPNGQPKVKSGAWQFATDDPGDCPPPGSWKPFDSPGFAPG